MGIAQLIAPSEAVVRGSGAERARASGIRPREGLIAGPVPRSIATTRIMTTNVKSLLLLIAAAYGRAASDPIISWRCRNANRTIDVPAPLPAVAHTALMAAGVSNSTTSSIVKDNAPYMHATTDTLVRICSARLS